jgi:lipopolysaccharide transport system permease protein
MLHILNSALMDIAAGIRRRRLWMALAAEDIFDQHRRTTLGPIWLLVNYFAFVATFIFIFAPGPLERTHVAYIAVGLLVWTYLSDTVSRAVTLFEREESFIKGTTLPLSVYVMRLVLQNLIRAAYAAFGCLAILLVAGVGITGAWVWSGIGIALVLAVSPAVIVVFAFLGAFFPDSRFIVSNGMPVAMFVTPVFWDRAEGRPLLTAVHDWNPFTHFLAIVRQPIVDGATPAASWLICLGATLGVWVGAVLLLGRFRRQIAFLV